MHHFKKMYVTRSHYVSRIRQINEHEEALNVILIITMCTGK